jgi:hypothetical protein
MSDALVRHHSHEVDQRILGRAGRDFAGHQLVAMFRSPESRSRRFNATASVAAW